MTGSDVEAVRAACRALVDDLRGALACGVAGLNSRELVAVYNKVSGRTTLPEVVVSGLVDMFRGPAVDGVARLVRQQRGVPENGAHYFEEIQIVSRHNLHFASVLASGDAAIMLITARTTVFQEAWDALRRTIPAVEMALGARPAR